MIREYKVYRFDSTRNETRSLFGIHAAASPERAIEQAAYGALASMPYGPANAYHNGALGTVVLPNDERVTLFASVEPFNVRARSTRDPMNMDIPC